MSIFGAPQPLNGTELVTILQMQNGVWAECSMPLSDLIQVITLTALAAGIPKTEPTSSGIVWDNAGVISIS